MLFFSIWLIVSINQLYTRVSGYIFQKVLSHSVVLSEYPFFTFTNSVELAEKPHYAVYALLFVKLPNLE